MLVLLRIFASVFISGIGLVCVYVCVRVVIFVWFLITVVPHRMSLGCSFLFVFFFFFFLVEFQNDRCYLFSKCLLEITHEAILSWTFVCWKFLNYSFNFSTCDWSVHLSVSSYFSLGRVYLSKNLSISSRLSIYW